MTRRSKPPATLRSACLERTDAGCRITLPAVGVGRAGHGLFWVGLSLCAGLALITAALLVFPHVGSTQGGVYTPPEHRPLAWQSWPVLGLLWLACLGATLAGMNMGLRRATIEVVGETVHVRTFSPMSNRSYELQREEIRAIKSGATGLSIGRTKGTTRSGSAGKSVNELQFTLSDGRRLRLLAGRDSKELAWIAAELNRELGLD